MADHGDVDHHNAETAEPREPRGFGQHAHGLASEYAQEQGWGLNEEERTRQPEGRQVTDGGTDYEYGARDFGDEPVDEGAAGITQETVDAARGRLQE